MHILAGLNDKQRKGVESTEGRIRVVAGAGSGKTRVIAHRYAYLVNVLGIDPGNILTTTFTNKAAKEMTSRISKMVERGHYNDFVCTLHGFCVKFLRKEIFRIGFPKSFTILDEVDCKALAKEVMTELNIKTTSYTIQKFLSETIAKAKAEQEMSYIPTFLANTKGIDQSLLGDPFVRYLHKQIKLFALDFDDLIYTTIHILENFPEARQYWTEKLNYIMVDEAQDLSKTQWKLMEILASEYNNLFIVGDPDQAIYEWRGASPDLFVNFRKDQEIILNQNYRSTPNILNVANSIIANNKKRIKKDLFTENDLGDMTIHHHAKTEKKENEWIVEKIEAIIKGKDNIYASDRDRDKDKDKDKDKDRDKKDDKAKDKAKNKERKPKYSDIAILMRSAYLSRQIEQALIAKTIPYTMWGGIRFFDRKEIKDMVAYLRLIAQGDDLSFLRVINEPSRKLGKVFINNLKEVAEREGDRSLFETLQAHINDKAFARPTAIEFVDFILRCRRLKDTMELSDFANYVLEQSGLKEDIRNSGDEDRIDNLNELMFSIETYEEDNKENDPTIESYLQDIALYTNQDQVKEKDSVKLMTIHQAKGLEFPYVFIVGLTEGILPNYRSIRERNNDGEEEERRLMYVAVTRAMKALYLTESEGYMSSTNSGKYPSRFLKEIDKNWLIVDGNIPKELWLGGLQMMDNFTDDLLEEDDDEIKEGDTVYHDVFGEGKVLKAMNSDSFQVEFEKGKRVIRKNFLTKI